MQGRRFAVAAKHSHAPRTVRDCLVLDARKRAHRGVVSRWKAPLRPPGSRTQPQSDNCGQPGSSASAEDLTDPPQLVVAEVQVVHRSHVVLDLLHPRRADDETGYCA
jgi:hypothetical protein